VISSNRKWRRLVTLGLFVVIVPASLIGGVFFLPDKSYFGDQPQPTDQWQSITAVGPYGYEPQTSMETDPIYHPTIGFVRRLGDGWWRRQISDERATIRLLNECRSRCGIAYRENRLFRTKIHRGRWDEPDSDKVPMALETIVVQFEDERLGTPERLKVLSSTLSIGPWFYRSYEFAAADVFNESISTSELWQRRKYVIWAVVLEEATRLGFGSHYHRKVRLSDPTPGSQAGPSTE
jgi:hypothetical protein